MTSTAGSWSPREQVSRWLEAEADEAGPTLTDLTLPVRTLADRPDVGPVQPRILGPDATLSDALKEADWLGIAVFALVAANLYQWHSRRLLSQSRRDISSLADRRLPTAVAVDPSISRIAS